MSFSSTLYFTETMSCSCCFLKWDMLFYLWSRVNNVSYVIDNAILKGGNKKAETDENKKKQGGERSQK